MRLFGIEFEEHNGRPVITLKRAQESVPHAMFIQQHRQHFVTDDYSRVWIFLEPKRLDNAPEIRSNS